jgi:hypothetical protein
MLAARMEVNMTADSGDELEDTPPSKSGRRGLIAVGIVLTLSVVTLASWQYAARPSGSTSRSLSWAKASCLSQIQIAGNASQLVPTGKSTTVVVSDEHLGPLNGTKEGTTWIVLKDGAAESGFYCALGDNGDIAESGPAATLIRPDHPQAQRGAYIGSTDRTGYIGLVARVPSSVTRVTIVTARGTQVLRPVEGLVACVLAVPVVHGNPLWAGVLISFNSSGLIVGTGRF